MANEVTIESADYGDFVGDTVEKAMEKAVEAFAPTGSETFEIDLVKVRLSGDLSEYYLHENSVENIQMEIEAAAKEWQKVAERESKGLHGE